MSKLFSWAGRAASGLWWLLDALRHVLLNGLLLALLVAGAWALFKPGPAPLKPKTALVLDVSGRLVEQRAGNARDNALRQLRDEPDGQTRLRDVLAALDAGAKDPAVTHALLLTDELQGAGLASLRELARAIERFKAAGKPVVAWASAFDQRNYFLAAHASEVWMHPMGSLLIQGFGGQRGYYKDLLDKLGLTAHVMRAGRYKNASENFAASGPSPETLEADGALLGSLWATWTADVEKARRLGEGAVMQAVDSLPASLKDEGGNTAQWALKRKFVDRLMTRDQMRAAFIERGERDDKTFRQVHWTELLARVKPVKAEAAVAVVVAEGAISDGRAGPGHVGGLSTAELVRRAREDDRVKAVVLRVNSPGGSAFGSELVRRELELVRQAGKPVVVSMGDLAASGGYWVALAADEVIADASTVTGSIGVIAMLPTAEGLAARLGVKAGGVATTWMGKSYDLKTGLDPRFAELVQAGVDGLYRDFTTKAAAARKRTPEQIDAVAQGRVWSGRDALAQGLVDRLGGLDDALKAAAQRAKLADGAWRTEYLEVQPGRLERLLEQFGLASVALLWAEPDAGTLLADALAPALGLPPALAREALQGWQWWLQGPPPRGGFTAAAHCLCSAP